MATTSAESRKTVAEVKDDTTNTSFNVLKTRIKAHYDVLSDYYYNLWGEHIHHGYFTSPDQSKEDAQRALISLLLSKSQLLKSSRVLDVGCGVGGTTRFLAREHGCEATGITISTSQVEIATRLSTEESKTKPGEGGYIPIGDGKVRFLELDAEKMGDFFDEKKTDEWYSADFDAVWISEAMSHLPQKELFFKNAFQLLKHGGKLVIADWFKAENLTEAQMDADIHPIEDGMLLPPLCSQADYIKYAKDAGFEIFSEPFDISEQVKRTWDISLSLIASPSLWLLALTQGRDIIAFMKAFNSMRTGYRNGTFKYAVMSFKK